MLLEALGTTIEPDLLVEALTHRSFSHEHEGAKNYERLEFLGDAVLELVSTETPVQGASRHERRPAGQNACEGGFRGIAEQNRP